MRPLSNVPRSSPNVYCLIRQSNVRIDPAARASAEALSRLINSLSRSRRFDLLRVCRPHVDDGVIVVQRHDPDWVPTEGSSARSTNRVMTVAATQPRFEPSALRSWLAPMPSDNSPMQSRSRVRMDTHGRRSGQWSARPEKQLDSDMDRQSTRLDIAG